MEGCYTVQRVKKEWRRRWGVGGQGSEGAPGRTDRMFQGCYIYFSLYCSVGPHPIFGTVCRNL